MVMIFLLAEHDFGQGVLGQLHVASLRCQNRQADIKVTKASITELAGSSKQFCFPRHLFAFLLNVDDFSRIQVNRICFTSQFLVQNVATD